MELSLSPSGGGENIKVFVRVRPPDPYLESEVNQGPCLQVTSDSTLSIHSRPEPKIFTFDTVADIHTTQEDVFSAIGRPIIESCMCGYNGTIFAYGQTGSGKTFTMIGPSDDSDMYTHELRGIIPRSFEYLFSLINREKQKYGDLVEHLCRCSFLEIYNEQVFDLLDAASSGLNLRENIKRGVYVDGLTEHSVTSARDAYEVLTTGWVNRRVASTSMNRESSRSHAVFILTIESKKRESKDSVAKIKTSLLNLIDLAGSERQRDTHTVGLRLKEAGSINKSLSALGNVIMALVDIAHGKSRHVHYRDSKLTFLLRDSLGGNAKTNLVANVHPSARCFGETLSTLNFARRAKMIKNKAVVNEDTSGNILQLQTEIKRLREALDKYRAGQVSSPSVRGEALLSPMVGYRGQGSDDEKAIKGLREMLAASMATRDKAETEKMVLFERVENLERLCDKKEKFLQSTKMILKFRETHIGNLERARRGQTPPEEEHAATIKLLQQEIEQLKCKVSHHPEVTRFAMENRDLRAELKRVRATASGSQDLSKDLARAHHYTLQLERQLRYYLSQGSQSEALSPVKVMSTSPSKLTVDVERLQARCKHLQEELEKTRHSLSQEREEDHLKETKLEAGITALKKTNQELERSIEALKLKNSVERATLNDMHMNTIRSMLSPKRNMVRLSRSVTNTPFRRAESDPLKAHLSFNAPVSAPTSPYSLPPLTESPQLKRKDLDDLVKPGRRTSVSRSVGINTDFTGDFPLPDGVCLADLNIEGALTDELKLIQDDNRNLQEQVEELELQLCRVSQQKATLEAQQEELMQLTKSERETCHEREQGLLEQVALMTTSIADLTSSNTVLDSEVVDLRVCLQSADKELEELKAEGREERKSHGARLMEYMQRIGELEQLLSSQVAERERRTEDLQTLQDEMDTAREEIGFKEHRILALEMAVLREKERVASMEGEMQALMDRYSLEVEKNTRLNSELQEGHSGREKLVATLDENLRLQAEVQRLEGNLRTKLVSHQQEVEEMEGRVGFLVRRQAEDKEALSSFMAQVQELRAANTTQEARIASLVQEVDDSTRELGTAASRSDHMAAVAESLRKQLREQTARHQREIRKKEFECEVVADELERLNEQCQQLQSAFEEQSIELSSAQREVVRLTEENDTNMAELRRLQQQQHRERRESFSRSQSFSEKKDLAVLVEARAEEIDRLKSELDHAAALIDNYEQAREEKNRELQHLKDELLTYEELKCDYPLMQTNYVALQWQMDHHTYEFKEREKALESELREMRANHERLEEDLVSAVQTRDKALTENTDLLSLCQGQRNTIEILTDQLERYKTLEEKLFAEKERLKSQLEAAHEERAKLAKECDNLSKENALLSGHQNLRQKIQYHASTKMENNKLKEEVFQLQSKVKCKSEQIDLLQKMLSEKEFSKHPVRRRVPTPHTQLHSDMKENVEPP